MALPKPPAPGPATGLGRRRFLQAALATAGASALCWNAAWSSAWTPAFRIGRGSGRATLPPPPAFPDSIPVHQQAYQNWSRETLIEGLWTAVPRSPEDVALLANWAAAQGWRVRPKGASHGWSPLLLPRDASGERCLLVDTTPFLTAMTLNTDGPVATVTAQTGITLDVLLQGLGAAGLGLTTSPAPGCLTLGGALAVDGHGAACRAEGEVALPGRGYGSWNNAILALTAVVWDPARGRYALRTFRRDEPGIAPLLTHVGRAFVTEATLQVGPEIPLRCQSSFHIPAATLFAAPEAAGAQAFQSFLQATGRVEAIWFPFTAVPWLKVWSLAPEAPACARRLTGPYPYTFANTITPQQSAFVSSVFAHNLGCTPLFQNLEMAAAGSGLLLTDTLDVWGPARYSTLYVRPSTLRLAENGYAVLTRRDRVQGVIHDYCSAYTDLLRSYEARGSYPMNGPLEIRVSGLNGASEVALPGALEPQLSALRPQPGQDWDCAVWLDALTLPGTPEADRFCAELEAWIFGHYTAPQAGVRVEWAKGWGYTPAGAWTNDAILGQGIPASLTRGQGPGDGWAAAARTLDTYDPQRIFGNDFLDGLFG